MAESSQFLVFEFVESHSILSPECNAWRFSYCGYDRGLATVDSLLIVVRCHRDGNWSIDALCLLLGVYCFFIRWLY